MRTIFRYYVINTGALYLVNSAVAGMVFEGGTNTLLLTGLCLMAMSILAKPVINLLLLPVNLITFGLFRWVASAVILYLVTLLVKSFKIIEFSFAGFSTKWVDIPAVHLEGIMAFVAFSFLLSLVISLLHWVSK